MKSTTETNWDSRLKTIASRIDAHHLNWFAFGDEESLGKYKESVQEMVAMVREHGDEILEHIKETNAH